MLIGNGSLMYRQPSTLLGGSVGSDRVAHGLKNRNRFAGGFDQTLGAGGYLHPAALVMPQKSGALSCFTLSRISVSTAPATLAAGRNIAGQAVITITTQPAQLQLVVSANGLAHISISAQGTLGGAVWGYGQAIIRIVTQPATLGAVAGLSGVGRIRISANGTITAIGHLTGHITPYTELSPENLAQAVWSSLAARFNSPGTMGELVNASGAGGNPWVSIIEDDKSAADLMRLFAALLLGKSKGHPDAPIFMDTTGTIERIKMIVDANGNRTSVELDAKP